MSDKWKIIYRQEDYKLFGLNCNRNFLDVDIYEFEDEDELFDWTIEELQYHGCDCSCIFMVAQDGTMYASIAYYNEDEEEYIVDVVMHDFDLDWFSEVDAELRLCCYSVVVEIKQGIWKVLEV